MCLKFCQVGFLRILPDVDQLRFSQYQYFLIFFLLIFILNLVEVVSVTFLSGCAPFNLLILLLYATMMDLKACNQDVIKL